MAEETNSSATDTTDGKSATSTGAEQSATASTSETTTTEQNINDPVAYFKAQAEKTERLLKNTQEELNSLKANKKQVESEIVQELTGKYETLNSTVESLKKELEAKTNESMRLRAISEAGLTPDFANRLQGATAEELLADATKLAELLGTSGGGKRQGEGAKTGNTAGGSKLTMDAVKAMTTEQYIARKDEVDEFMRSQKS